MGGSARAGKHSQPLLWSIFQTSWVNSSRILMIMTRHRILEGTWVMHKHSSWGCVWGQRKRPRLIRNGFQKEASLRVGPDDGPHVDRETQVCVRHWPLVRLGRKQPVKRHGIGKQEWRWRTPRRPLWLNIKENHRRKAREAGGSDKVSFLVELNS